VQSLQNNGWIRRLALTLLSAGSIIVLFAMVRRERTVQQRSSDRVIAIACAEAERQGWSRTIVNQVEFRNNVWIVEVERYPVTYGGHATVRIAENGAILSYEPGL
jgi:hypothetical protein